MIKFDCYQTLKATRNKEENTLTDREKVSIILFIKKKLLKKKAYPQGTMLARSEGGSHVF